MAKKNVPSFAFIFNRLSQDDSVEKALVLPDTYSLPNLPTATTLTVTGKGNALHEFLYSVMRAIQANQTCRSFGTIFENLPLMAAFVAFEKLEGYNVYLKTGKASAIRLTRLDLVDDPTQTDKEQPVIFNKAHFKSRIWVVPVPLEVSLSIGPSGQGSLFNYANEGTLYDSPLMGGLINNVSTSSKKEKSKKADRLMKKADKKARKAAEKLTAARVA